MALVNPFLEVAVASAMASDLKLFLEHLKGSKDCGLVIAVEEQTDAVAQMLATEGFESASDWSNLFSSSSAFMIIDSRNLKNAYDVAVQYSTGQVEIFEAQEMKSHVFTPNFGKQCVVFVISNELLSEAESKGLSFRSACGLTIRV